MSEESRKWPVRLRYYIHGEAKADFRSSRNTYVNMTGHERDDIAFIEDVLRERFYDYRIDEIRHGKGEERYISISYKKRTEAEKKEEEPAWIPYADLEEDGGLDPDSDYGKERAAYREQMEDYGQ